MLIAIAIIDNHVDNDIGCVEIVSVMMSIIICIVTSIPVLPYTFL